MALSILHTAVKVVHILHIAHKVYEGYEEWKRNEELKSARETSIRTMPHSWPPGVPDRIACGG